MDNKALDLQSENESMEASICQYASLGRLGHRLSAVERCLQLVLRIPPALERRLSKCAKLFFRRRIGTGEHDNEGEKSSKVDPARGDRVRIKPYDQIECTLDRMGKYRGLNFLPGMRRYCGREAAVLKRPRYILDGGGKIIRECRDLVILEGLYCDGKGLISNEGCDRCCMYYWKPDWLEKA